MAKFQINALPVLAMKQEGERNDAMCWKFFVFLKTSLNMAVFLFHFLQLVV